MPAVMARQDGVPIVKKAAIIEPVCDQHAEMIDRNRAEQDAEKERKLAEKRKAKRGAK